MVGPILIHNLVLIETIQDLNLALKSNNIFGHRSLFGLAYSDLFDFDIFLFALLTRVASQCGYVVSTSAFRQGVPGSNPIAARKSCEVYPGLGILQPQWNPYPTLTPPSC